MAQINYINVDFDESLIIIDQVEDRPVQQLIDIIITTRIVCPQTTHTAQQMVLKSTISQHGYDTGIQNIITKNNLFVQC